MALESPANAVEAVIDTNVLLDWLVFCDPQARPVGAALMAGQLRWVLTQAMWDELASVLQRPLPAPWPARAATALDRAVPYRMVVDCVGSMPAGIPRCTDSDDQKFIDLALTRVTPWLITRDKALLKLSAPALRSNVQVVTPAQWALRRSRSAHAL